MSGSFSRRFGRFIRRLGFRAGVHAAFLLARRDQPGARSIRIRGVPHPLWVRGATSDLDVFEQIFVHQGYDFARWIAHRSAVDDAYALDLRANRQPVIIDCGANIGFASIWFAEKYPRAVVYAVESDPANFEALHKNVAPYANIIPVAAGISDKPGRLSLANPNTDAWGRQTIEDEHGPIPCVDIDDLLARSASSAPLIVKIDIEGYERVLFRSNTHWTKRTPLIVFEVHDWLFPWQGTANSVLRCLSQEPRDYLIRGENVFSFAQISRSRAE